MLLVNHYMCVCVWVGGLFVSLIDRTSPLATSDDVSGLVKQGGTQRSCHSAPSGPPWPATNNTQLQMLKSLLLSEPNGICCSWDGWHLCPCVGSCPMSFKKHAGPGYHRKGWQRIFRITTFDLGSGTNMAVPSPTPDLGFTPLCLVSGQAMCLLSLDTQGALVTSGGL